MLGKDFRTTDVNGCLEMYGPTKVTYKVSGKYLKCCCFYPMP